MIMPNNENEEVKAPELKPDDMFKLCVILLRILGGKASVPKETFDNFPKTENIDYQYDTETKRWIFTSKGRTKKKGILTLKRNLILPPN